MDQVYRRQKHIYDLTRKYYLFGRDRMIAGLNLRTGARVLELGCGTGRNLACIARAWPAAALFGLDISHEMLALAARKLESRKLSESAMLAVGDAGDFDARALFGTDRFDRVVLSYALSMIPPWQRTIVQGTSVLAPGGQLHIVDFGDFGGLPRPVAALLRLWLAWFHVTPRDDMPAIAAQIADQRGLTLRLTNGPLRYYRIITLART
eukprot:gene4435-4482_t